MNKYRGPLGLILAAVFLIVAIQWGSPKRIDWTENYYASDKRPYGARVLVDLLPDLFPGQPIHKPQTSLHKRKNQLRKGNYLLINSQFFPTRPDINALLERVSKGSNAFIAAAELSSLLADTLQIHSEYVLTAEASVKINFVQKSRRQARPYEYKHIEYLYGLVQKDSGRTVATPVQLGTVVTNQVKTKGNLAVKTDTATNFVAIPWGKGYFFIHTMPQAFSNYNMVHPENIEYISKALSYLPPGEVFWEEYYTDITYASTQIEDENGELVEEWNESKAIPIRKNEHLQENSSIFRFLLDEPTLRWALYLTLFGLVLFVFFEAKRRQRIVPIIKPLANTTLEFTETVGRLYFQYQDHKNIAEKKITYFLEHIRHHYYLSTNHLNEEFYTALARKSGFAKEEVETLFRYIQYIQKQGIITEDQLLDLNRRMEIFIRQ